MFWGAIDDRESQTDRCTQLQFRLVNKREHEREASNSTILRGSYPVVGHPTRRTTVGLALKMERSCLTLRTAILESQMSSSTVAIKSTCCQNSQNFEWSAMNRCDSRRAIEALQDKVRD
jgi:hypothetical protein